MRLAVQTGVLPGGMLDLESDDDSDDESCDAEEVVGPDTEAIGKPVKPRKTSASKPAAGRTPKLPLTVGKHMTCKTLQPSSIASHV